MYTTAIYENSNGENFTRYDDFYGDFNGETDIVRATKKELDQWLAARGFEIVGYEKGVC